MAGDGSNTCLDHNMAQTTREELDKGGYTSELFDGVDTKRGVAIWVAVMLGVMCLVTTQPCKD